MKTTFLYVLVFFLAGHWNPVVAQDFAVDWFSIDGGASSSSAGEFELEGTIGQPDTAAVSGGGFEIEGGFSASLSLFEVQPPRLSLARVGQEVIITWESTAGFQLERSVDLRSPANWQTVGQMPVINNGVASIVLPITGNAEFFRLRK